MNLSNGKGSMSTSSWKSGDAVSEQFPAGLRVLVVDDDPTCLMIVEKMLKTCLYEVTTCNRAEKALSSLQANKNGFDIVISDVHMPDMDGFKLLELIGLEMDLPVIMMSADDGKNVVMKGVTHGACDYLIKPIRIEELKNIWQHVVRKRKNEWKEIEQSASVDDGDRQHNKHSDDADYSSSANEGNWKNSKRRKDEEDELEERDDTSTLKKPRVVWSVELHQQFVAAVNQLGIDKAVPKKILELMNVPGLTRENVASHLQKYRLYLRRLSGVSQHQGGVNNSFIGTQDTTFGPISSLSGLDFQALAVAGQLPAQSLATLQAAGFARPSPKSAISIPLIDQRNIFSFDNSKLKFGDGQQQQPSIGNSKQLNLLHGIPTTMEPKQLASLHQSAQSFESINMSQGSTLLMQQIGQGQPQPRGPQMLGENSPSSRVSRLPANISQPIMTNGIGGGILSRNGSQSASSTNLSFPMSHHGTELPGNSFPLGTGSGLANLTSKAGFQEEVTSDIKGSGGFMPGYYILNELQQIRSNDWELQNMGLAFDATSQHSSNIIQGNLDNTPAPLVHQGLPSSSERSGQMRNNSTGGGKATFCAEGTQNLNSIVSGSVRIKSEAVHDTVGPVTIFQEHYGQEDLMSALLKQQEGIGPANNEFDFDGYSIDNIPV